MRKVILAVAVFALSFEAIPAVEQSAIDQAIARGVAGLKRLQQHDGTWAASEIGGTALAALALLECEVPKTDPSIVAAAKAVREQALTTDKTYSISLSILFLDKLGERSDTPLIESLIVRLLAGQRSDGGWSYTCPTLGVEEVNRIRAEMDPSRALKSGRDLGKLPQTGQRKVDDLPQPVRDQLAVLERFGNVATPQDGGLLNISDNSNTQFATLGMWVGRRYGVPTQAALLKNAARFRTTQNRDGGWSYTTTNSAVILNNFGTSSAQMTCAGLFALAAGHGATYDVKKAKDGKAEKIDVSKDPNVTAGMTALATAVGVPVGWSGNGPRHPAVAPASGKAYYFLWSLERVMVAFNLEMLGKKDWYNWGAEILLANQQDSGLWMGEYGTYGADTAFALMFLKKANLTRDLSGALRVPRGGDPRVLRGGAGLRGVPDLTVNDIGDKAKSSEEARATTAAPAAVVERAKPIPETEADKEAIRLADSVVRASGEERNRILRTLRDSKGAIYTESLVWAILRMEGDNKRSARVALAERFARLKDTTLREYLKDEEAEIRRAAALAAAARESKVLIPDLIRGLSDADEQVRRAMLIALRELTKQDFGPTAEANEAQRRAAIAAWEKWWKENSRE